MNKVCVSLCTRSGQVIMHTSFTHVLVYVCFVLSSDSPKQYRSACVHGRPPCGDLCVHRRLHRVLIWAYIWGSRHWTGGAQPTAETTFSGRERGRQGARKPAGIPGSHHSGLNAECYSLQINILPFTDPA